MQFQDTQQGLIIDKTVDVGRRSAMRKIVVGVGVLAGISVLPERWTTPIIGQIVLPAHAQTSASVHGSFVSNIAIGKVNTSGEKLIDSLAGSALDFFVADAQAVSAAVRPDYVCVTLSGSTATAVLGVGTVDFVGGYIGGTGTVTGGVVVDLLSTLYTITFTSVSSSLVNVRIVASGFDQAVSLTPSSSCHAVTPA